MANSLDLQVEISPISGTKETRPVTALLDCSTSGLFIDTDYVKQHNLPTHRLSRPIPVNNVDGTPNEAGPIEEIVERILKYRNHSEIAQFVVTRLGKQQMLLGFPWLKEHNLEVDWELGEVTMSCCPAKFCTCKDKVRAESKIRRAETRCIRTCRTGPFPAPEVDWNGIPDLIPDDEDDEEETKGKFMLEEGDRVFYTQLLPEPTVIRTSSNFSQCLAEAHRKNSSPKESIIPSQYADFAEVFSEKAFEALPKPKEWDHAVELLPDAKMSNCKVYPLSLNKQTQLDEFITENLALGRI